MTIVYSADDPVSSRWTGVGRKLTAYECNYNFYQHEIRIAVLEANYTVTVSLATITQPSPSTLLFTLTDASTQGPFVMPVATFRDRDVWATSTAYEVNDTFTANGSLYRVLFDHTSDATSFSPTANDGAGHDYYAPMMSSPGNALPTGGATGMVLNKSSGTDYAVSWGYKLPTGGTLNQVLLKQSSTNQDAAWTTLGASMVAFTPVTGSVLSSSNVSAALEELAVLSGSGGGALSGLSDVHYATGDPQNGALLYFDNGISKWVPSVSPSTGKSIFWDGTAWKPTTSAALGTTGAVNLNPTIGANVFTMTPTGDVTLSATSVPNLAEITLLVTTSGATSYTITFDSGSFKSQGTLATGTVTDKVFVLKFIGGPAGWFLEIGGRGPAM